jgi:hypothetical protein
MHIRKKHHVKKDVSSYWMEANSTGNLKSKQQIALFGEIALLKTMDLS